MYGSYPHTLTIVRSEAGAQDPLTGEYSGTQVTIYEGRCDAQEKTGQIGGLMIQQAAGAGQLIAELHIFLDDEESMKGIKVGDTGTLNRGHGEEEQIKVIALKFIDGSLFANRL